MKMPPPHPRGVARKSLISSSIITKPRTAKQISRALKRQDRKSSGLALAVDNEHLNTQLRAACDDYHSLLIAYRSTREKNQALEHALSASDSELRYQLDIHNRRLQDVQFNALMERDDLLKQLQSESVRLSRKLAAERSQAEEEQELLRGRITRLEGTNAKVKDELTAQMLATKAAVEEATKERVGYLNAMTIAKDAFADLDCAKTEVNSVRDDLAELLRLNREEGERGKLGLPPAYGGLDDVDQPPWKSHCQDAGRLDGGPCGMAMSLLESVAEENFGRELRKAFVMAGRLCQSRDAAIKDSAGAELFRMASKGIANACVSLVTGMEKVVQMEVPPTQSLKKRPLPISIPSTTEPAFKKLFNSKNRQIADPLGHTSQSPRPSPSTTRPTAAASNHTLAHRAIMQTFSLIWQLLAAFDLRPITVTLDTATLRLQLESSWRVIDDCLRQSIDISAKSPLTELDETGRCVGCCMKGCAGNCVRMARLQGYMTQFDAVMRGLRSIVTIEGKSAGYLSDCSSLVEDMVSVERRCAAVGRGGSGIRHVEFVDLIDSPEMQPALESLRIPRVVSFGNPLATLITDRASDASTARGPESPEEPDFNPGDGFESDEESEFNPTVDIPSDDEGPAHRRDLDSPTTLRLNLGEIRTMPELTLVPSLERMFDLPPQRTERRPREAMEVVDRPHNGEAGGTRFDVSRIFETPTSPMPSPAAQPERVLESPYSPGVEHPRVVDLRTSPTSPVESVSSVGSEWLPPGGAESEWRRSPAAEEDEEEAEEEEDDEEEQFNEQGVRYALPPFAEEDASNRRIVYGEGNDHARGMRILGAAERLAAQRARRVRREGLRPRTRRTW